MTKRPNPALTGDDAASPDEVQPAPALLEALMRVAAGREDAAICARQLLSTVDALLWPEADFAQAKAVGETLALRSLGVSPRPSDASPKRHRGVPADELLEEKFRMTAPEITHPLRVLGVSAFLVCLLSQKIPPGLKDGAERLIEHLKNAYPVESGIHDQNATEW